MNGVRLKRVGNKNISIFKNIIQLVLCCILYVYLYQSYINIAILRIATVKSTSPKQLKTLSRSHVNMSNI